MALNASTLQSALTPKIEQEIRNFLTLGAVPYPQLTGFCGALSKAIAEEVVAHIQANAVATGSITGVATYQTIPTVQTYPVSGTFSGGIT